MLTVHQCDPNDFPVQDNLFQTAFWGKFKTAHSQKALYFIADYSTTSSSDATRTIETQFPLVLMLRTTKSNITYAYAPKAPSISIPEDSQGLFLEQLALALQPLLPATCACIRFDLPWDRSLNSTTLRPELRDLHMNFGTETGKLHKSPVDHLCPDTVLINLSYPPEQMLAKLRQQTRNSVRRAYKSDIVFSRYSVEEALAGTFPLLKEWHAVYEETAIRKHFYYEKYEYFHELFSFSLRQNQIFENGDTASFANTEDKQSDCNTSSNQSVSNTQPNTPPTTAIVPPPTFYLFTARKDGTILSGLILALCGHRAYYLYAGSSMDGREFMPNYGLQWEAMLFARRSGCTRYDLLGIAPTDNKAHPMYGLYLFKTGFGGDTKHFSGAWDYVYDDDLYDTFKTEEQLSSQLSS